MGRALRLADKHKHGEGTSMEGDVISLSSAPTIFDHLPKDRQGLGYTLVPPRVVTLLFEEMRGGDNEDYLTFMEFRDGEAQGFSNSYLGGAPLDMERAEHLLDLQDFMIEAAPESLRPAQVLVARDDERLRSAVFVSGADCIVGVGYEDHARCPKGTMMAALLLYVLAGLNMGRDMTLFKNAYNYLPFVPEIGLSYHFFEFADDLLGLVADGQLEALGSQDDDPASRPSSQPAGELLSFQGSD